MYKSQLSSLFKADMNGYMQRETAAIFFYQTVIQNSVLKMCMLCLLSFVWAYSGCKESEIR